MEKYGNINNLLEELSQDAQTEINKILREAEEYKANKEKQIERDKQIRKRRILDDASRKAEKIKKGFFSNLKLELKRIKLKKQEENITRVFDKINQSVEKVSQDKRYPDLLKKLIQEIIEVLHDKEIELCFSRTDEPLFTDAFIKEVEELFQHHHVRFSRESIKFDSKIKNGVMGLIKNKNLIYNNTLKAKMSRLKNEMAYAIYKELFQEEE
ncbi:MAG: V-type ATP synthase subunit E family protein [bacterium]|nr:V-type ATP synthase subunit E family protein [bacterium]